MEFEKLRAYLLNKKSATEDFPFGPEVMVFKVMGKMFALIALEESPLRINLKCDPDLAMHFRAMYEAVKPGYHMNKKHWNTVTVEESDVDEETVKELIDHSYDLVYEKLTKKQKALL